MGKVFTGLFAAVVSFLPFISALLFFSGDKYHDTRIGFWNHDPSMFPESVAEKISMGAEVVSINTFQSVAVFALSALAALFIVFLSVKPIERLGKRLNPPITKWISKLIRTNESNEPASSESELIIFVFTLIVYIGIVVSIVFSVLVLWSSNASKNLALRDQAKLLARYECSLNGKETCEKMKLSALRVTKFFLKNREETGFAVECSPSNCILYTNKKKVIGISASAIESRETITPIIEKN